MRILGTGLAAAVAIAWLPAASPSADAAGKGKGTPVATESLTIVHEGLQKKKPSTVKVKGKGSTKGRRGVRFSAPLAAVASRGGPHRPPTGHQA
jgi:hypothetical protein